MSPKLILFLATYYGLTFVNADEYYKYDCVEENGRKQLPSKKEVDVGPIFEKYKPHELHVVPIEESKLDHCYGKAFTVKYCYACNLQDSSNCDSSPGSFNWTLYLLKKADSTHYTVMDAVSLTADYPGNQGRKVNCDKTSVNIGVQKGFAFGITGAEVGNTPGLDLAAFYPSSSQNMVELFRIPNDAALDLSIGSTFSTRGSPVPDGVPMLWFIIDIDECATGDNNCDVNADCENSDGSFTCTCKGGYEGDGVTCSDIDECATGTDNCDDNAVCKNTDGSFTCTCDTGYEGDGVTCTDIDECATGADKCHANADCANTDGSYTCACKPGYAGDGFTCTDIDECATGTDNCDANADCANTDGSYTCTCRPGYAGDGFTCSDVDECATGADQCDVNADCFNTDGSYTCSCKPGYAGDGFTCKDVNECATGAAKCDANADCANTDGSYTCTCRSGYTGDGFTCSDIDECATGANKCDPNADCTNTEGSYTCKCKTGFAGDGFTCDECGRVFDLVFVLDRSTSVHHANHDVAIAFIGDVVKLMDISLSKTRIGFIGYASTVELEFDLDDYSNVNDLVKAIDAVPYTGGVTYTGAALTRSRTLFNPSSGEGARSDVPQMMVLLTDGHSSDSVGGPASNLKGDGVVAFCIGIADGVVISELNLIASDPDDEHVFLLQKYGDLDPNKFVQFLDAATCEGKKSIAVGGNAKQNAKKANHKKKN